MTTTSPDLSVIVTCYFEEQTIDTFHRRLSATLETLGKSYEIILVNDGSTDATLDHLNAIYDRDPRVSAVVDLYKNAGQQAAITAGVTHGRGRVFVFIDSDLQLDPEELPLLLTEVEKGFDVVSGYRHERHDSILRSAPSRIANIVMRRVARAPLRDFGCTFKVIDGTLIRAFEFGPYKPIRLPYLIAAAGRCSEVRVTHHARPVGRSGWTLAKLFAYHVDNIVGLSQRPFQMLSVVLFLMALLIGFRVLIAPFFDFRLLPEITGGLLLSAIIGSFLVILAVSAAIGEYAIRSYVILQGHPRYIVRSLRARGGEAS